MGDIEHLNSKKTTHGKKYKNRGRVFFKEGKKYRKDLIQMKASHMKDYALNLKGSRGICIENTRLTKQEVSRIMELVP